MARQGIYVGNKEITQRYVGKWLVWRKVKVLFNGYLPVNYDRNSRRIIIGITEITLRSDNITALEINGQQLAFSSLENYSGHLFITFSDSIEEFERKSGFNQYRSYYESVAIKIFGGRLWI